MTYTAVIASYKYGHLVSHCIETILAQSKQFDKIYLVDDGAGDCWDMQYMYPEVECVLRPINIGTVANFQEMLGRVNTEYCMFIGADNWLRSDALEKLAESAEQEDADIVTYDMMLTGTEKQTRVPHHIDEMIPVTGDYYWSRKLKHHGSMLYRTRLAQQVGGYAKYNNATQTLEDLSLWEKMIRANAKVTHVPQAFLYYRHHRSNYNKYG